MSLAGHYLRHLEHVTAFGLDALSRHAPGLPSPAEQEMILRSVEQGAAVPESWPHVRRLLLALAPVVEQTALQAAWIELLETGLTAALAREDREVAAHLCYTLGQIDYHHAEFDRAAARLTAAAESYRLLQRPADEARCYNRLAYVARLTRDHGAARAWVEKALALLDDRAPERRYAHFVLGVAAFDAHRWEESVSHMQRALAAAKVSGDARSIAIAYGDLGPPLRELSRYDEAVHVYTTAIAGLERLQDWDRQARYRMNLGNVYLSTGHYADAIDCYRQAEAVFRKNNARTNLVRIAKNSGLAYRGLGQWPDAIAALQRAVDRCRTLGDADLLADALDDLGLTHQAAGDLAAARQAFADALSVLHAHQDDVAYAARKQIIDAHVADLDAAR